MAQKTSARLFQSLDFSFFYSPLSSSVRSSANGKQAEENCGHDLVFGNNLATHQEVPIHLSYIHTPQTSSYTKGLPVATSLLHASSLVCIN